MQTLKDKIQETLDFVIQLLGNYQKPTLMCSFGKDSMVLLHLLRSCGILVPIVFYTDPSFPRKYGFARRMIEEWDLEVHEYPPESTALQYKGELIEVVSMYSVGSGVTIALPKNVIEYDGKGKLICGRNDFLLQPKAVVTYPWDVVLIGHKSADVDPFFGQVKLHTRVLTREKGPAYAYPLIDWTDEDVWEYTRINGVPMQRDRYDVRFKIELKDKTNNSDYWQGCTKCINKNFAGQQVFCPKTQNLIPNISEKVNEFKWKPDYFG